MVRDDAPTDNSRRLGLRYDPCRDEPVCATPPKLFNSPPDPPCMFACVHLAIQEARAWTLAWKARLSERLHLPSTTH
jgi:hypothetical protein